MPECKYDRLPHAGDFEQENGTEAEESPQIYPSTCAC